MNFKVLEEVKGKVGMRKTEKRKDGCAYTQGRTVYIKIWAL